MSELLGILGMRTLHHCAHILQRFVSILNDFIENQATGRHTYEHIWTVLAPINFSNYCTIIE